MSKQKISPFYTIPSFSPTPPFLEKAFHPHPYFRIRGSQTPLNKGWGDSNYAATQFDTIYTRCPLWCDQDVYRIAKEIQLLKLDEFDNIFLG